MGTLRIICLGSEAPEDSTTKQVLTGGKSSAWRGASYQGRVGILPCVSKLKVRGFNSGVIIWDAYAARPLSTSSSEGKPEQNLTKEILEPAVPLTCDAENRLRYQNPVLPRHPHRLRLAGQIEHVVFVANACIGSREPGRRQHTVGLVWLRIRVEAIDQLVR